MWGETRGGEEGTRGRGWTRCGRGGTGGLGNRERVRGCWRGSPRCGRVTAPGGNVCGEAGQDPGSLRSVRERLRGASLPAPGPPAVGAAEGGLRSPGENRRGLCGGGTEGSGWAGATVGHPLLSRQENYDDPHKTPASPVVHIRGLIDGVVEADLVEALQEFGPIR